MTPVGLVIINPTENPFTMNNNKMKNGNLFWGLHHHFNSNGGNRVAVDVGAMRGAYTATYCSLFDKVLAFEPNPDAETELSRLNFENLTVYNMGLWSSQTQLDFYSIANADSGSLRGISTFLEHTYQNRQTRHPEENIDVHKHSGLQVIDLDSLNLQDVDFIKIDVEGSELEVLKGAEQTLARCKPTLQIEISYTENGVDTTHAAVEQFLHSLGYEAGFGYNPDYGMDDIMFVHSEHRKVYFVNALVDPLNSQQRAMIAGHPHTHPDVFGIIANHDLDMEVLEALVVNPTVMAEHPDLLETATDRLDKMRQKYERVKNICPLAWNHFSTFSNGNIRQCCEMIGKENQHGTLFDDQGVPLNSNRNTLEEIRNNKFAKQVRQRMMDGEVVPECEQCYHRESLGMTSKRTQFNNEYLHEFVDYLEHTEPDGTIDTDKIPMRNLDLRFGNQCNQKCRTCGPGDSSLWVEDYVEINRKQDQLPKLNYYGTGQIYDIVKKSNGQFVFDSDDFDWYSDSVLWQDMLDNIPNITHLYFTGGEPTINKKHRDLLQYCISNGYAENICLDYNTNLQATPTYLYKWWKNFKRVGIGASIDGFGTVQEYMRHPAKWDTIKKNIEAIGTLDLDNIKVDISPTISVMNILNYTDLADYILEQGYPNITTTMGNHTLYYPDFYCVQVLPPEVKQVVMEHYERWFKRLKLQYGETLADKYRKTVQPVLDFMNQQDQSHRLPELFKFNRTLDKVRNESWYDAVPDIAQLLRKYDDN